MKFATVLPIFNCENYLEDCLESILNQTYHEFIIYAIDDGSTDKSAAILKRYAAISKNIIAIYQDNCGVSRTRNKALNLIYSRDDIDYITFLDSDDILDKDFYLTLNKCLTSHRVDYAVCGLSQFDKTGLIGARGLALPSILMNQHEILDHYFTLKGTDELVPTKFVIPGIHIYRSSAIQNIFFRDDLNAGEDLQFFYDSFNCLKYGLLIPKILYYYRLRKSSLSHTESGPSIQLLAFYCEFYLENKNIFPDIVNKSLQDRIINTWWAAVRFFYSDNGQKDPRVKNILDSVYLMIIEIDKEHHIEKKNKKRLFFYNLGSAFLKLYFWVRTNKNVISNNANYFE